jgi:polyphosphate kinase 2 (PPK2 family)
MSGAITATTVMAAASVAGVAMSAINGQKQASAAKDAQAQAQANADKQLKEQDQATNRANQKSPDTMAILDAATQAGKGGASGTMLTGAQGIDPNLLTLGKSTLLGG